jgi:hypothetical protein
VAVIERGLVVVTIVIIVLVKLLTRNVSIPEHDSYLGVAKLLRTAVNQVEGRSAAFRDELARNLHEKPETDRVGYWSRRVDGMTRCLDLWEDVAGKFLKEVKYD